MAYRDDISALGADHHWDFDGDSLDQIGSVNGTDTSMLYTSTAIAEDATNCAETDAVTDRVSLPTTTEINNSAQARKAVAGWFMPTAIQNPPKNVYGEGDATQAFRFILGWGNNLMFEVDTAGQIVQLFGDVKLTANRSYHLCMVFEGTGYGNLVSAYLDGVPQLNAEPANRQPGVATLPARSVAEFGDPAGTVAVGGTAVILIAPINGKYNHWATWGDEADAVLTETEVREELFEKGALPTNTISSGTEAAMQTSLDAYADTVRVNSPLCIRINAVTGDGDLTLTADNVTFDPLASIHIQYMGTGTLTWRNTNGADASISSTPAGGTIVIANVTDITVTALALSDFSVIENVRIYLEADTGGPLPFEDTVTITSVSGDFDQWKNDGSDAAASDPDTNWIDDTNVDDGDIDTSASASLAGSDSSNYLEMQGTNAGSPGLSDEEWSHVIIHTRFHYGNGAASDFPSPLLELVAPSGGWTNAHVAGMEIRLWLVTQDSPNNTWQHYVYYDGEAGGTNIQKSPSTHDITSTYLPAFCTFVAYHRRVATVTHTAHGMVTGDQVKISGADQAEYNGNRTITVTGANTYTYLYPRRSTTTPATGTIKATAIIMNQLTNVSGIATKEFDYVSDQPITGWARKTSQSILVKQSNLSGTINSNGYPQSVLLISDE